MENKVTAIIILNFNNFEDTINCVESVLCHNSSLIKIIVVDNGSTRPNVPQRLEIYLSDKFTGNYLHVNDKSLASIGGTINLPFCTYVESAINDGYARGNNKGLRLADRDDEITHVLVLNNDVLFVEDIIPSLLDWELCLADSAFLSPILLKKDKKSIDYNCARKHISYYGEIMKMLVIPLEKLFHYTRRYVHSHQILRALNYEELEFIPVDLLSGSCLFVSKDVFRNINYFDPNTFLYFEEDILYELVSNVGLRNYLIPNIKCVHIGAQSTSVSSERISSYSSESEIYYFRTYCKIGQLRSFVFKCSVKWYNMWLKIYELLKRRLTGEK